MIEFWLVCVGVLFVLAEFVLWIKDFILPLPVYILGGAFLAIASNYEGGMMAWLRQPSDSASDVISQTATIIEANKATESNNLPIQTLPSALDKYQDQESSAHERE